MHLTMENYGLLPWEITSNTRTSLEIKCEGYFSNSMIIKKFELIGNKLFVNFEIKEIKFKIIYSNSILLSR